jgi:hypothetical protein
VEQKLSLPVQLASQIMDIQVIPVRYKPDSYQPIVMMPTYDLHREMVLINIAVIVLSLLVTIVIAGIAHRHANKKLGQSEDERELQFERVDLDT